MKIHRILVLSVLVTSASVLAVGPAKCSAFDAAFNPVTLTVGTDSVGTLGYIPFEQSTGGTITGFDVAVAAEVAHRLGFTSVTFRQIPFSRFSSLSVPSIFPLLNEVDKPNSQIDLAIAALSIVARTNSTFPPDIINFPNIGYAKYSDDNLGIILRADAEPRFTNPLTVLDELRDVSSVGNAIFASRESQILFAYNFTFDSQPTLTEVVADYKDFPGPSGGPSFILTDNDTAVALGKLAATDSSLFGFPVQVLTNVIDQKNVVPSLGLGIAVGGVSESGTTCTQLLANVSQALKDMEADGTLAVLREQFGVTTTFTGTGIDPTIGAITPSQTTTVAATINSNVIHNFYFTKYGTPVINVGPSVTPTP